MPSPAFSRRPLTLLVVTGLSIAAGCSKAERTRPAAFSQNEWTAPAGQKGVQLVTDHYDLRITGRDSLLRGYLPDFMETAFDGYRSAVSPSRENADRMIVYLFATRNEWAEFTTFTFPAQADTYLHLQAGGYTDQPSAMAVTHDVGRDRTLSLLAHEGFHQYVARHLDKPLPAWLNEGLACQWEAFKLAEGRPVFTPRQNYLRRNALRSALNNKDGFIPLPRLLGMHAGEAVIETGQTVRSYYSQVWLLILFLQEGCKGKYAEGYKALLTDAGTDRLEAAVGAYRATNPDGGKLSEGEMIFRHYITDNIDECATEYFDFARQVVY